VLIAACSSVLLATGTPAAADAPAAVNGRLLLATGPRHERSLDALDIRRGERLHLVPYGGDISGTYSPDGTKVAFMTNYDGDLDICVINADGTGLRALTKNSSADSYPSWSPDGKRIAFTSNRDGDFDIYVMNADGSNQVNLTNRWSHHDDDDPHWSPDGTRIAFNMAGYDSWDVWEVRLVDQDPPIPIAPLVQTWADDWFDSWSPDGKHFLIESDVGGDFDIYTADTPPIDSMWSTAEPKVLADDASAQGAATWSPDGKQIAYSGNRDGDWEVYLMNADGTRERQLTHNDVDDIVAHWQSLHDLLAPRAHALPSEASRGERARLRFTTSDNSGRTSVAILILDGRRPVGYTGTGQRRRLRGRTYSVVWRAPKDLSRKAKFCIEAYDPSGNESERSCAPIRLG
jgi:Tol biopolymer transport system component